MLKKTKITTNIYWIVNSMYTVSYTERCTSCTLSIDHHSRAALDNRKGGGGIMPITRLQKNPPTICLYKL